MSVFVSFDYDNDRYYKFLLEAWHANPRFRFTFQDGTPSEINSTNVGRVKAAITTKSQAATHTLVIVGQHANTPHRHRALIGHRNWINIGSTSRSRRAKLPTTGSWPSSSIARTRAHTSESARTPRGRWPSPRRRSCAP